MQYVIRSLQNARSICYVVHDTYRDLWDMTRRSECLAEWAGKFETLGDGMVQHAPEYPCKPADLTDFCASTVRHCLDPEVSDGADILAAIASQWTTSPFSRDDIAFAMKVKHNPDKKTYYNLGERKVSAAESRRHDRRWVETCEWMKGDVAGVFGILNEDKRSLPTLDALARYKVILDTMREMEGCYYGAPIEFMRDRGAGLGDFPAMAFESLALLVQSAQLRTNAERYFHQWNRAVENHTGVAPLGVLS